MNINYDLPNPIADKKRNPFIGETNRKIHEDA